MLAAARGITCAAVCPGYVGLDLGARSAGVEEHHLRRVAGLDCPHGTFTRITAKPFLVGRGDGRNGRSAANRVLPPGTANHAP
jgi:hypothetical protein